MASSAEQFNSEQPMLPGFEPVGVAAEPFDTSNIRPLGPNWQTADAEAAERRARIVALHGGEDVAVEQGAPDPELAARATGTSEPRFLPRPRMFRRRRPTGGQGPDYHDDPRVEGLDDPYPRFVPEQRTDEEYQLDLEALRSSQGYREFKAAARGIRLRSAMGRHRGDPLAVAADIRRHGLARRQGSTYNSDNV